MRMGRGWGGMIGVERRAAEKVTADRKKRRDARNQRQHTTNTRMMPWRTGDTNIVWLCLMCSYADCVSVLLCVFVWVDHCGVEVGSSQWCCFRVAAAPMRARVSCAIDV